MKHVEKLARIMRDEPEVYRATVYVSPDETIKITRQHKGRKNGRQQTFLLTVGKPNFRESLFIAGCLGAGEPFPVKKVQLKHYPKKKR